MAINEDVLFISISPARLVVDMLAEPGSRFTEHGKVECFHNKKGWVEGEVKRLNLGWPSHQIALVTDRSICLLINVWFWFCEYSVSFINSHSCCVYVFSVVLFCRCLLCVQYWSLSNWRNVRFRCGSVAVALNWLFVFISSFLRRCTQFGAR